MGKALSLIVSLASSMRRLLTSLRTSLRFSMKTGDLIRIVSNNKMPVVILGIEDYGSLSEEGVVTGTPAVFIEAIAPQFMGKGRIRILINGVIRWLYDDEYEPL